MILESAPFSALTNGVVQSSDDDVPNSVFFGDNAAPSAVTDGRILYDLGATLPVGQINTYSWHSAERNAQKYSVYGAIAPTSLTPGAGTDPTTLGYALIATVSSTPSSPGVAQGVSINDSVAGNIGSYRYLLFSILPSDGSSASTNTFYSEIDVTVVPEPTTLAALGLASLTLLARRRQLA